MEKQEKGRIEAPFCSAKCLAGAGESLVTFSCLALEQRLSWWTSQSARISLRPQNQRWQESDPPQQQLLEAGVRQEYSKRCC